MPNRSSNGLHHHASMTEAVQASMANMQELASSLFQPHGHAHEGAAVQHPHGEHHTLRERAVDLFHAWQSSRENRLAIKQLLMLDDALLRDIGVKRGELLAYMALPLERAADRHLIEQLAHPDHDDTGDHPGHDADHAPHATAASLPQAMASESKH